MPVYNEERTLPTILDRIKKARFKNAEIIIVDDHSKDSSPQIIAQWVKNERKNMSIEVITHKRNTGKGAGIKTALSRAQGTYFVVQDADLEYKPKEISTLLSYALKHEAPVVYGSRFLGTITGMRKPNYYANKFYNVLVRILYRVPMTDMHTCYKMIDTELFKSLKISADGFGYAPEVVSKLLRLNTPIKSCQ